MISLKRCRTIAAALILIALLPIALAPIALAAPSAPTPPAKAGKPTPPAADAKDHPAADAEPDTEHPPGTLIAIIQRATQRGPGDALGTIVIAATPDGATFQLKLHGLIQGVHGFHVHDYGECEPILVYGVRIPAGAAGGLWDPAHTDKHASPTGDGALGDLPTLTIAADGTTTQTLTAPRIKDITQLKGHALIIQTGGDTYTEPPPIGGGGLRFACGAIR